MILFREVVQNDINTLYKWLNTPHVKEFWDPDENYSVQYITNKYTKRIKESKILMYIIIVDSNEIGFIQTYYLDKTTSFKIEGLSKGIDLYISDIDFLHKGYGKDILIQFMKEYVFNDEKVEYAAIDPEVRNTSAIKAYSKAGFKHMNTAYNEYEKAMSYYMALSRDEFFCNL